MENSRKKRYSIVKIFYIILMNIYFYPLFFTYTLLLIVLFPFAFIVWKKFTSWESDQIMRYFIWLYGRGWLLMMIPFVHFKTKGVDLQKLVSPTVFVVNHLSYFDTYCMALLPQSNITFAIRSWPFSIPYYSLFMKLAQYINVENERWKNVSAFAKKVFDRKGNILFFPEGHRSKDGQLQRFYSGAFKLSYDHGVNIIPLCISGTDKLLPPGRWWLEPSNICLKALEPVKPQLFENHIEMRKYTKKKILYALQNDF